MLRRSIVMVIVGLVVLSIGVYFVVNSLQRPQLDTTYIGEFPASGTSTPTNVVSTALPPQQLLTKTGAVYSAAPLIANTATEELTDGFYTLTDDPSTYDIFYNEPTGILFISLYKEPLAFSRALAERKLLETLPLTRDEVCQLLVKVTTNAYVNPIYDGLNLGLSFCPDSVELE